jgi:hypothetical protein
LFLLSLFLHILLLNLTLFLLLEFIFS